MIINTDKGILFCMPNDKHKELCEGSVIGSEATKQLFDFNHAYSINDFENILPKLLKECKSIFLEISRLYVGKN